MQAELRAAYPELEITILGINQFDQGAENALMMAGRSLPWLQDVDANSDGQSDVWSAWSAQWRDVMIVDGDNVRVATYNVTNNNLGTAANYATLRDMILDAAFHDQRPYCNWRTPLDASGDALINMADVQCLFDTMNSLGARALAKPASGESISLFYDVNRDGHVSPIDALQVVNYLKSTGNANVAPSVNADNFSATEDQTLVVADSLGVLQNDSDSNLDALTAVIVTNPTHGSLTLAPGGGFTYVPQANYHGPDSFQYKASDGQTLSATATVQLTVQSVNDLPVTVSDSYAVSFGQSLSIPSASGVLANDSDADGETLTSLLFSSPSHGTVTMQSNGAFTYTPQSGYSGADSFQYSARDPQGATTIGNVSLQIQAANTFRVSAASAAGTTVGQTTTTSQVSGTAIYDLASTTLATDLQLAADDHLSGNTAARVVLIEYLDIQCPPCGLYHPIVRQLEEQYAGNLLVVRRHLPLTSIHPNAFAAAVAAEAANRQGAYEDFIDLAYQNQSSWSALSSAAAQSYFEAIATSLGLNLTQFRAAVSDPALAARVQRDMDAASRMSVNATPTFFLNGQRLTSPPASVSGFGALIQTQLDQSTEPFVIDRATGQIRLVNPGALQPAVKSSYEFNVRLRDTSGLNVLIPIHIDVTP